MKITINGKTIEGPLAQGLVLGAAALLIGLLAILVIPILGFALAIVLLALAVAIPLLTWKVVAATLTEKFIFFEKKESPYSLCSSQLYESMSTNKRLIIRNKSDDVVITATDDYNKVKVTATVIRYLEKDDCIELQLDGKTEVTCPHSQAVVVITASGNIAADNLRSIDVATASGNVNLRGLMQQVKVAAAASDISVTLDPSVSAAKIDLAVVSGKVEVHAPAQQKVCYSAKLLMGELHTERLSEPEAAVVVNLAATKGQFYLH